MDRPFKPTGSILRGEGAVLRSALYVDDTRELVTRAEAIRAEVELWMVSPDQRRVADFGVTIDDLITDGPIFHAQDPAWPDPRNGYNLKWTLPAGYTTKAPARYRIVVHIQLTGNRRGHASGDLVVEAPV